MKFKLFKPIFKSKFDIHLLKSNKCPLIKDSLYGSKQPNHYVAVEEGKDPKEGFVPMTTANNFPPFAHNRAVFRPKPLLANDQYRVDGKVVDHDYVKPQRVGQEANYCPKIETEKVLDKVTEKFISTLTDEGYNNIMNPLLNKPVPIEPSICKDCPYKKSLETIKKEKS